ncbi:hypothetical protein [Dokdonella sp.]|uniref:hypothetical protein n=1 Tax=Dokdonella sp. TaxID=2291710 RepID=UPI003529D0C0
MVPLEGHAGVEDGTIAIRARIRKRHGEPWRFGIHRERWRLAATLLAIALVVLFVITVRLGRLALLRRRRSGLDRWSLRLCLTALLRWSRSWLLLHRTWLRLLSRTLLYFTLGRRCRLLLYLTRLHFALLLWRW